jgi:hypothetical protein
MKTMDKYAIRSNFNDIYHSAKQGLSEIADGSFDTDEIDLSVSIWDMAGHLSGAWYFGSGLIDEAEANGERFDQITSTVPNFGGNYRLMSDGLASSIRSMSCDGAVCTDTISLLFKAILDCSLSCIERDFASYRIDNLQVDIEMVMGLVFLAWHCRNMSKPTFEGLDPRFVDLCKHTLPAWDVVSSLVLGDPYSV